MPSLFVSIFGPDGSGKSTQARILADYLFSRGSKVKIVWIKSYHTLAYVLSRIYGSLSPNSITVNAYGHIIRIGAISSSRLNRLIWAWIEFVSVLPLALLRVYLPLSMGRVVIAERYFVDAVASIAYTLDDPDFESSFVARLMLRFIPKNSVLIHLDSDYDEISERRGSMADPEDYIRFQRSMYDGLSMRLGAVKIDTSRWSIEDTA